MIASAPPLPFPLSRSASPALDAATQAWRIALRSAESGSGFLPLSVFEVARLGGIASSRVMPALDLLARLGVLLPCPPLPGCVPFKVNLDPPAWALDAAVWPHPSRLSDLLGVHAAG